MQKSLIILALSLLSLSVLAISYVEQKIREQPESEEQQTNTETQSQTKMQVVFVLDCTGSMSGLIQAAKDKIWSIASGMSQASSNPDLSFGFVFYRDIGDAFVTKHIKLTSDMDLAYRELMNIQAAGGGDMPESVNQALHEAIDKFQWDKSKDVFKVVFLVGDAPPHMDYQNDVSYPETCKLALKKDIIINTIQCGNIRETTLIWREIAQRGGGEFLQLAQSGSEVVIHCPHDAEIARLMRVIDGTRIYYGSYEHRTVMESKKNASESINASAKDDVKAKRAEFNYSNSSNKVNYFGSNELISDWDAGKVKIEDLKDNELPENMKKMTITERKVYVKKLSDQRKEAEAQLAIQIKERTKYVEMETQKLGEDAINNSFSGQVHQTIVKQAKTKNIVIDEKVKN